jgi:hypothetical protein
MKNIQNYNTKRQLNGYQLMFTVFGLQYRANYKNDKCIGYEEYPYGKRTNFYIR